MSWLAAAFWLAAVAAPVCWIWGGIALVGTPRQRRFVFFYPVWAALCTSGVAAVGVLAPWPVDAGFAYLVILVMAWQVLVGPLATILQLVLIYRWWP